MSFYIVIPCYNEEQRLSATKVIALSQHPNVLVYLANDGSTDNTSHLIQEIAAENQNINTLDFKENQGKSQTLYRAYQALKDADFEHIGFLDADFSTSGEEFLQMEKFIRQNPKYRFIFASRISTLNNNINRSPKRHYIGRIIISLLNIKYRLCIYDTQCGAKIFDKESAAIAIEQPFITKWLFDIEIFLRLRKRSLLKFGYEYPLKNWNDVAGSKLSGLEGLKVIKDIYKLITHY